MPTRRPALDLALCLAWVGVIFLCMYYGRAAGPWFEGASGRWAMVFLAASGLGFAAWVVWRMARLSPPERAGRGLGALLCLGGLGLLAWWQPLLIERSHLLLYGVLGVLAWRAAGADRGGAARFLLAAGFCVLVGLADEVAQHYHPQRMFDSRDVITNGASAVLAMSAASLLRSK
ncbi:MAG: VanZ family protein [Desulfarculaceae bacterium]|nr:VanZ family protein [Desulfarculaceae bacterium]MCF8073837.1 VanZ family protein [Desulfarculaceae bacterium]MCF8102817.1 VanZ family protein [Desulfarculaceae bacterium]MCF8116261.1 VanZ family protein [Desulfarculaceae bacterium]